jgi:AraC-like DNA-binding protein
MDFRSYLNLEQSSSERDTYFRMRRAREFVDRNFDLPIDLQQMAQEAYFSPYHFLRLFRKAYHKTPHEYLVRKRIERAKQLLSSTDLSVTQICFDVGFQSLGSFSTLFHNHIGHAPTVFRSKMIERKHFLVEYPRMSVPACYAVKYTNRNPAT